MVWINLIVLAGLVGFSVYLKNKNKKLEGEVTALRETQESQANAVNTHTEILSAQKEVMDSQKELLNAYREKLDTHREQSVSTGTVRSEPEVIIPDSHLERKQRESMAEEKLKFEKEVQKKKKNMDWYEKEFRVALGALLELFIHVPADQQRGIVAKMPASVIKKGFKRLSDCL